MLLVLKLRMPRPKALGRLGLLSSASALCRRCRQQQVSVRGAICTVLRAVRKRAC